MGDNNDSILSDTNQGGYNDSNLASIKGSSRDDKGHKNDDNPKLPITKKPKKSYSNKELNEKQEEDVIKAIKNQIKNLNPIFKKDEEFAETLKEFTLLVNARKKNGAQADKKKDKNMDTPDDDAKMATTDGLQEKDKNMD